MQGLFGSKFHKSSESFSLRLNSLIKIGLSFFVSLATLFLGDPWSLSLLLFGSFAFAITQIRFKTLMIIYLFFIVIGGISMGSAILLGIYFPQMREAGPFSMLLPFMRIIIVMQTVIVTALSTSPQEILINLKLLKLPRFIYLPVLVMLRFIPSFINDLKQISESLKTRGLRITPLSIIIHPILTMRCSVFPLIFRALRSSDELAIASELKGVGYSKKVTSFKKHIFRIEDVIMIIVAMLFFSASIWVYMEAPKRLDSRERMTRQNRPQKAKRENKASIPTIEGKR
jgi:energy-coupling factor transport system permease protein